MTCRTGLGTSIFNPALHDDGEKRVLGQTIPAGGGEADVDRLVEIVTRHPSTARHIATKMVRRFVSEQELPALVERVAQAFTSNDGDIRSMLRTILKSDEFAASAGAKFKTPLQFVASSLRVVGADTYAHAPLIDYLVRMGQGIFQFPTPDGYPDKTSPWLGTLLWRWNFAFSLAASQVPSVDVSLEKISKAMGGSGDELATRWFRHIAGHDPTDQQRAAIASVSGADVVGLLLSSPVFQRY